jgi:hypothetical protein
MRTILTYKRISRFGYASFGSIFVNRRRLSDRVWHDRSDSSNTSSGLCM